MKFYSYVVVEEIGSVQVLKLEAIEWPASRVMEMEAVDLISYREGLAKILGEKGLGQAPSQANPILPVKFKYESPADGQVKEIEGMVLGEEVEALLDFAQKHLLEVTENRWLDSKLSKEKSFRGEPGKVRAQLIAQLNVDLRNRKNPYDCSPLLFRPAANQKTNDGHGCENLILQEHVRGGKRAIFITGEAMNHFMASRIAINGSEVNKVANIRQRGWLQTDFYRPFYPVKRKLQGAEDGDDAAQVYGQDFVRGVKDRQGRLTNYVYSYGGETGVVADPQKFPLGLVEKIDSEGRQLNREMGRGELVPLDFLKPQWVISSPPEKLELEVAETVAREEVELKCQPDLLQQRWVVNSLADPINLTAYENSDKTTAGLQARGNRGLKAPAKPASVIEDTKLLAYILQRSKEGVYSPEHEPTPVELEQSSAGGEELTQRALCTVAL